MTNYKKSMTKSISYHFLGENASKLSSLMKDIATHCSTGENEDDQEFEMKIGKSCLAQGVDKCWYRATVTAVQGSNYEVSKQ